FRHSPVYPNGERNFSGEFESKLLRKAGTWRIGNPRAKTIDALFLSASWVSYKVFLKVRHWPALLLEAPAHELIPDRILGWLTFQFLAQPETLSCRHRGKLMWGRKRKAADGA